MSKHQPPLVRRFLLGALRGVNIACLGLIATILFLLVWFHFDDSKPSPEILTNVGREEFKSKFDESLWPSPPPSATNFYYAHNSGFHGFVELFRFDAAADDCAAFARESLRRHDKWPELTPIESPPEPVAPVVLESSRLESVEWFDIDRIRSGFEAHTEPSSWPRESVWIDTDRGRFYYFSAD